MQKWEYITIQINYVLSIPRGKLDQASFVALNQDIVLSKPMLSDVYQYLNKLGEEGWELVNAHRWGNGWDEVYYFKRPLA